VVRTTVIGGGAVSGLVRFGVGRHRILTRAELRHENASVKEAVTGSDGGGVRTVFSLTAEEMVTVGRLTIAPSLRWESLQNDFRGTTAFGLQPEDLSNNALTGKIGLSWVLDPGLVLRGSAGSFHRNPNFVELFGDTGAVQGNPNLRPERGNSAELGIQWSRKKPRLNWNLECVGFARRVDDMIALRQLTAAVSKAYNVREAEVYGLEGSLILNVPRGWSFQASGTLQRAEDTSDGYTNGQPLPFQPDVLGQLGVGYTNEGFLARWELHYVGENSTTPTDFPEFRIPERVVHDVLLSHRWRSGIRAGVDLRNLFDRRILDLDRYPLPGRTIFVHVGWRPGGPA
jgi:vitamin B12 transporter